MENVTLWQERQLVGKRKHIYFLYLLMCQLLYIHDLILFPHQHYWGETLCPFYCWENWASERWTYTKSQGCEMYNMIQAHSLSESDQRRKVHHSFNPWPSYFYFKCTRFKCRYVNYFWSVYFILLNPMAIPCERIWDIFQIDSQVFLAFPTPSPFSLNEWEGKPWSTPLTK